MRPVFVVVLDVLVVLRTHGNLECVEVEAKIYCTIKLEPTTSGANMPHPLTKYRHGAKPYAFVTGATDGQFTRPNSPNSYSPFPNIVQVSETHWPPSWQFKAST